MANEKDEPQRGDKRALSEEEVWEFLAEYQEAYENGDPKWFELHTRDATFFTVSAPTRIDSVEEYRRGFEAYFSNVTRKAQILSPEIRIAGSGATVTLHNRVTVDGRVTENLRGTLVVERRAGGDLKVTHLHFSPLVAPEVLVQGKPEEAVTLLEQRVATAAATVGTPK
jgi:ketosteroid isomerase-like protein